MLSRPKNENSDEETKTKTKTSILLFVPRTPGENSRHLSDDIISTTEGNLNASVENKQSKPSALYSQRTICPKVRRREMHMQSREKATGAR